MHVQKILHEILSKTIHKTRIKTLLSLLIGLFDSKQLKLTQLGRSIPTSGQERSGILRVNRFLSNIYYQKNSIDIYHSITQFVLKNIPNPDIIVDWSSLPNSTYRTQDGEHLILRASYSAQGRAITLYEEVHPKRLEGNPKVHKAFLENLQSILPDGCIPCIITDAGYKTPWFKSVAKLGWNYIGRVACATSCYDDGAGFQEATTLFDYAQKTPRFLGSFLLTKTNRFETNFYVYKGSPKGRHKWTKTIPKKIAKDKDSTKHGKSYREPWVLVSSLRGDNCAERVVEKYKRRMTIEEGFRDTKSVDYGFSMKENVTIDPKRYIVWLMLAALGSLIAWIIGFAGEKQNIHYAFQANSYKKRRVLSFFYLGCQMIRKKVPITLDLDGIRQAAWEASG